MALFRVTCWAILFILRLNILRLFFRLRSVVDHHSFLYFFYDTVHRALLTQTPDPFPQPVWLQVLLSLPRLLACTIDLKQHAALPVTTFHKHIPNHLINLFLIITWVTILTPILSFKFIFSDTPHTHRTIRFSDLSCLLLISTVIAHI